MVALQDRVCGLNKVATRLLTAVFPLINSNRALGANLLKYTTFIPVEFQPRARERNPVQTAGGLHGRQDCRYSRIASIFSRSVISFSDVRNNLM